MPNDFLNTICVPAANWMIQPFVKQHPFMKSLNPKTVNIVRIVIFNTGKRAFHIPATLVYACDGNDGWCPYVNQWTPETALRKIWDSAVKEREEYYKE